MKVFAVEIDPRDLRECVCGNDAEFILFPVDAGEGGEVGVSCAFCLGRFNTVG